MSSIEEQESREEQRLSRALAGKVGSNKKVTSWAPVATKSTPTTPVNFTGQQSGGVDTSSAYTGTTSVPVNEEKLRAEQARLKKWGLDAGSIAPVSSSTPADSQETTPNLSSSQSIEAENQIRIEERRLSKMGLSSNNLIDDYVTPAPKAAVDESPVDSTSILNNVDAHTNEEKMRAEQKRLERWGLKIGGNTAATTSATSTPVVSAPPSASITSPSTPSSPYVSNQVQQVAQQYGLTPAAVQPLLDSIVFAAKSVKLILHKKSSSHDIAITLLMNLVKDSASFAVQLNPDQPISFDISQSCGKLAGAVNELVKGGEDREPVQTIHLYEEIQTLLGLLYLGIVAN
eukprot:gene9141-10720_t